MIKNVDRSSCKVHFILWALGQKWIL